VCRQVIGGCPRDRARESRYESEFHILYLFYVSYRFS
jgi:hypothetical protein